MWVSFIPAGARLSPSSLALYLKPAVLRGDSAVDANDMTFWMVQKHEMKFWKTGNAWPPDPTKIGTKVILAGCSISYRPILQCRDDPAVKQWSDESKLTRGHLFWNCWTFARDACLQ